MTITLIIFLTGLFQASIIDNSEQSYIVSRINGPIVIDGHVDEPAWELIEPLPLVAYTPVAGLPPSERTEIRIAYDDNYFYASIRAYDSEPDGIRANTLYRDRYSGDDNFHILIDTFNDYETGMVFVTSPTGNRRDAIISNDGEGSGSRNNNFTSYWDAASQIDENGWYAEIRIPFTSMSFQADDGQVTMGFYVQRGITRKNERVTFPQVPDNISAAYFRPSLAQRIVFEGIKPQRSVHVTPYVIGGLEHRNSLNESSTGYDSLNDQKIDAGFDLRYGLTNNLTLDLTVNTDFAQVEADEEQANLTRFNIFFPEKRQFFLERSGLYEFNLGGSENLFHSRRIGLTTQGETVRILGGGRLYGRIGSWDVGILNMQTDNFRDMSGENFGVMRLRRKVINPYSFAGAILTSRISPDGSNNFVYGLDSSIRLKQNDYLTLMWSHTFDEQINNSSIWSTSRLRINWERRTRRELSWSSTYTRSGDSYNPGIGFVSRLDYHRFSQMVNYGWMPGSNSPLHWHSLELNGLLYIGSSSLETETMEYGLSWNADTKSGHQIRTGVAWHYENVPFDFQLLQQAVVPAGDYNFILVSGSIQRASGRLFRPRFSANSGTFYDGWRMTLEFAPTWNISKHLELEGAWLYNLVNLPTTDLFAANIGQLRVRTALNTKLTTTAFIQFNSSANLVSSNIRFRYNFRDGNDFWVVYNEGTNTNPDRFDPRLPRVDTRVLMVKYTHTFKTAH
jgi:hypothetical protein